MELKEAIKAINTGKSEDIYGLSIENIIFAGEEFLHHLLDLINNITAPSYRVLPTYRSSTMMFLLFLCFLIIW
jgi:hypothetical protein